MPCIFNPTGAYTQLVLASQDEVQMTGTQRLYVLNQGQYTYGSFGIDYLNTGSVVAGFPRQPYTSFTIPDGFDYDVVQRLTVTGTYRITIQGSGSMYMNDSMATRSRLVLAGAT